MPTNFCTVCSMPISNAFVHRRWHEAEDQRFSQLTAALNAAVSGVNRLSVKVDKMRRAEQQTHAEERAGAPVG